jgi:hypothetical protein
MSLSDAISSLKITLGHWQAPSAWDRVKQDEPRDPVEGEFLPATGSNATLTTLTITTQTIGSTTLPTTLSTDTTSSVTYITEAIERVRYQMDGWAGNNFDQGTGTSVDGNQPSGPTTGPTRAQGMRTQFDIAYGRSRTRVVPPQQEYPYARNGKERKILASIRKRLPELIQKFTSIFGAPDGSYEWNARFFEFVNRARERNAAVSHRRAR